MKRRRGSGAWIGRVPFIAPRARRALGLLASLVWIGAVIAFAKAATDMIVGGTP